MNNNHGFTRAILHSLKEAATLLNEAIDDGSCSEYTSKKIKEAIVVLDNAVIEQMNNRRKGDI